MSRGGRRRPTRSSSSRFWWPSPGRSSAASPVCALVVAGFLFILDQGYWRETAESLTLVLTACLVCMAIGVPIGLAAAHPAPALRMDAPRSPT